MQRRRSLAALLVAGLVAASCAHAAHVRESSPRRLAAGCVELMMSGECEGVFAETTGAPTGSPSAGLTRYELACETLEVIVLCGAGAAIDAEIAKLGGPPVSEQQDGPLRRLTYEWDEPTAEGPGHHGLAVQLMWETTPGEWAQSLVKVRYASDAGLEFDARLIVDSVRPRKPRS